MIVFGTSITDAEAYDQFAAPGIRRAAEPDSKVLMHQTTGSLFRNYNLLLDKACALENVEAVVLVHQDAELLDEDFCARVREAVSDPEVAIVGCAGAIGVRSIAWWEGAVTWASFTHKYPELGGGDFPAMTFHRGDEPSFAQIGEVDSIDGFVMVMSPWAARELRFDESLGKLHGYDFDICSQARAAGKKVVTADFRAIHHHSLVLISEPEAWIEAYIRLAEKWDGMPPGDDSIERWRRQALRAEAEAACAKGSAQSNQMQVEAMKRQLDRVEASPSWRLTKPLRAAKRLVLRRRR
jgi:Glycosyltransferase like family